MQKQNSKEIVFECIQCVVATLLCAIGIYIFINCQIGADTIDVLIDGIHKKFNLSIALADQIFTCIIFVIAFLVSRKRIGVLSIVNTLLIGICITLIEPLILRFNLSEATIIVKLIAIMIAQLCFGICYGLLQTLKLGINTTDALLLYFVEKYKIDYVRVRLVFDALVVSLGLLLGGVIGIGTVVSITTTGIFIKFFKELFTKIKSNSIGIVEENILQ